MAGTKGVVTKGGSTKGRGQRVITRGGSNGGRGGSNGGRGGGRDELAPPPNPQGSNGASGGGGDDEFVPPLTRKRQKVSQDGRGKAPATHPSTSHAGNNSSHRSTSSIDSTPTGGKNISPPSQGTHNSNVSRTNSQSQVLPLQYPQSSNRPANSQQRPSINLNLQTQRFEDPIPNHQDEDEPEDDGEEEDDEEPDDDEDDEQPPVDGVPDLEALVNGNGEGEDYDRMLDNILSHPGRQALPYLSPRPIPQRKSLW